MQSGKKVAVVTGGAGGIGSSIAGRLANDGYSVAVADLNIKEGEKIANQIGASATAFHLDANDPKSIEAMVNDVEKKFGQIDLLINNVVATSIADQDRTILETPIEAWDEIYRINVRSYFIATKLTLPLMLQQGGGVIVNIASASALGGDVAFAGYGSSKAAVVALSRYTAVQYGRQGIRCNSVCPGVITTPKMLERPAAIRGALAATYTPELGAPTDVAAMVSYLGSDEARYVNGATLSLDGGLIAGITPWVSI